MDLWKQRGREGNKKKSKSPQGWEGGGLSPLSTNVTAKLPSDESESSLVRPHSSFFFLWHCTIRLHRTPLSSLAPGMAQEYHTLLSHSGTQAVGEISAEKNTHIRRSNSSANRRKYTVSDTSHQQAQNRYN
jgi:hypothetical protein